ncbi:MAG: sigma-70 family RNA polymerase sigma factor, partial [Planctomycetota bacterium]
MIHWSPLLDQQSTHPDLESLLAQAGSLRLLARRLLADEHLAEDAAQEAAVIALERRSAWGPGTVGRWMGTVTRHLALRWREGRAGREAREREVAQPEAACGGTEELERLELHRQLVTAVMGLEDPYRSTIVLRFFEGLDPAGIAERQGVSPVAVRKRLSRGLAMLRGRLADEFGDRPGGWCAALAWFSGSAPNHAGMRELLEVVWMGRQAVAIGVAAAAVVGVSLWIGSGGEQAKPTLAPGGARMSVQNSAGGGAAIAPGATVDEERVAIEAAGARASRLVVSTVDGSGRPLAGVEVLVVGPQHHLQRSTTDASGRVSLEGTDARGTLVASVQGRATVVRRLDRLRGPERVELPAGRRLAGRLLVDGEVPSHSLTLELLSNDDPLDGISASVRDLLRAQGVQGALRRGKLDALGRFAFDGLHADWSGELRLPRTRWFVEAPPGGSVKDGGSESLFLRHPAEGLELRATHMPS